MFRNCIAVLAMFLLWACSEPADEEATTAPAVEDSVFADQVQTLDRARGAEDTIKQAADAQRRALEEQER